MLLVFIKKHLITKKSHVFHHCTSMINLYAILKRKVKYLIIILRRVINNNSSVPERILSRKDASLAKIVVTTDDIANVIKNLNSNKSRGQVSAC